MSLYKRLRPIFADAQVFKFEGVTRGFPIHIHGEYLLKARKELLRTKATYRINTRVLGDPTNT